MAFWSLTLAQEDLVEPNKTSVTNSSIHDIVINPSSQSQIWCYGLLSVTVKSFMAVIGLCFLPLMSKSYYNHFLTTMIGLAVGSLTGSALFHLIPAAFELENKLNISLALFGGIYLFFIIEQVLKFLVEHRERSKILESPTEESGSQEPMCSNDVESNSEGDSSKGLEAKSDAKVAKSDSKVAKSDSKVATMAWMLILGDSIHNFIDGLAIGAAFSTNILTGISVSIAVLSEDFPHELGDFAFLLKSGMSMKQAVISNFLASCPCYLGLITGILLGELKGINNYIFAVAGGMFLYIALVDMLPELNSTLEEISKKSIKSSVNVFILQNIGILTGIFSLFVFAKYQHNIEIYL